MSIVDIENNTLVRGTCYLAFQTPMHFSVYYIKKSLFMQNKMS